MTVGPDDLQLVVDDIDRVRDGRDGLRPWLPPALVGLHDPAFIALAVVTQPVGEEGDGPVGERHDDAGISCMCGRNDSVGQPPAHGTHLDVSN